MKKNICFVILCLTFLTFFAEPVQSQIRGVQQFRNAQRLFENDLFRTAIDEFKDFIKNNPDDPRAHEAQFTIGNAYFAMDDFESAFKAFHEYTVRYFSSPLYGDAWFKKAECKTKLGDIARAAEIYEGAAKDLFNNEKYEVPGLFRSAEMYVQLGRNEKAIGQLSRLIDFYPAHQLYYPALILLSNIYADNGDYVKAIRELDKVNRANTSAGNKWRASYYKGQYYFALTNLSLGENALRFVIENAPVDSTIHVESALLLAKEFQKLGMHDKSIALLADLGNEPNLSQESQGNVNLLLAKDNYYLNNYQVADDFLQKALTFFEEQSQSNEVWYYLGKTNRASGDYAEAFGFLNKIFDQNWVSSSGSAQVEKFHAEAFSLFLETARLSGSLLEISLYSDVIMRFSSGFKTPSQFVAWSNILAENGDFPTAVNLLRSGLEKYPSQKGSDFLLLQLGQTFELQDNNRSAVAEYTALTRQFPGGDAAIEGGRRLQYLALKYPDAFPISDTRFIERPVEGVDLAPEKAFEAGEYFYLRERDLEKSAASFQTILDKGNNEPLYERALEYVIKVQEDLLNLYQIEGIPDKADAIKENLKGHYRDYLSKYADNSLGSVAVNRLTDLWIEAINDPLEKLSSGKELLSQLPPSQNTQYNDYVRYKQIALILTFDSDADSIKSALNAADNINIEIFDDALKKNAYYNLAKRSFDHGDFARSVGFSTRYMINYPRSDNAPEIRYLGATAQFHKGDYIASKQWADNIQKDFYYTKYANLANVILGDIFVWAGRFDEGITEYKSELVRISESDNIGDISTIIFKLGNASLQAKEFMNAEDHFRTYIELVESPQEKAEGKFAFARVLTSTGRFDAAVAELDAIQQLVPNTQQALDAKIRKADILLRNMVDYKRSAVIFKELSSENLPDSSLARFEYSYLISLYRQEQRRAANEEKKNFERRFRNLPKSLLDEYKGLLRAEEGDVYMRAKDFEEAEKIFNDIIKKHPNSRAQQIGELYLGRALLFQNKIEEGLPLLREFGAKYPGSPYLYDVYKILGIIQFGLQSFQDAYVSFSKAIDTEMGLQDSVVHRRYIKSAENSGFQGPQRSAIMTYLKHFPNAPDRIEQLRKIGQIYVDNGQFDEAISHFRSLLRETEGETEIIIQLDIARVYHEHLKMYTKALAEYFKILDYGDIDNTALPWGMTTKYNIALCYEQLGMYEKAIEFIDQVIQDRSPDPRLTQQAERVKQRLLLHKKKDKSGSQH